MGRGVRAPLWRHAGTEGEENASLARIFGASASLACSGLLPGALKCTGRVGRMEGLLAGHACRLSPAARPQLLGCRKLGRQWRCLARTPQPTRDGRITAHGTPQGPAKNLRHRGREQFGDGPELRHDAEPSSVAPGDMVFFFCVRSLGLAILGSAIARPIRRGRHTGVRRGLGWHACHQVLPSGDWGNPHCRHSPFARLFFKGGGASLGPFMQVICVSGDTRRGSGWPPLTVHGLSRGRIVAGRPLRAPIAHPSTIPYVAAREIHNPSSNRAH